MAPNQLAKVTIGHRKSLATTQIITPSTDKQQCQTPNNKSQFSRRCLLPVAWHNKQTTPATRHNNKLLEPVISGGQQRVEYDIVHHQQAATKTKRHRRATPQMHAGGNVVILLSCLCLATTLFVLTGADGGTISVAPGAQDKLDFGDRPAPSGQLERELNTMLGQHEPHDLSSKVLSEAVISRLMLGNASNLDAENGRSDTVASPTVTMFEDERETDMWRPSDDREQQQQPSTATTTTTTIDLSQLSGPEVTKLRKLASILQNYELSLGSNGMSNTNYLYPMLPNGQLATVKRAGGKLNNYLAIKQQPITQQRQLLNSYGRNLFDFGLGKRPDSGVSSSVLRLGDSSLGSHAQSLAGLGKRPSAHRYDFGLGKRVASPAFPRYDFGLGKRAPNRIRYDFGLGRR